MEPVWLTAISVRYMDATGMREKNKFPDIVVAAGIIAASITAAAALRDYDGTRVKNAYMHVFYLL